MARLIDADALKKQWSMADKCEDCPQDARHCQFDQHFTLIDICEMIDEAPTVALSENSITLEWTPDADDWIKEVAERALDEFEYKGRTIREWIENIMALPEPPEEDDWK